jgi:L-fuconolactonase
MPLVDTHLHLWERSKFDYSWITSGSELDADFTPEAIAPEIAEAEVTSAVLVQVGDFVEDSMHMLSLAERWPLIAGVVGWIPLDEPDSARALLDLYQLGGYLKGIRCLSHDYADDMWMVRESVQGGIRLVESTGLTLDLVCVTESHLTNAVEIARLHPSLKIVIDHLAKPDIAHDGWEPWASQIRVVAGCDNVFIKLSGLNTASRPGEWSASDWQPYVDHALECFTPARIMLGSDWPVASVDGDYVGVWKAQLETIAHLSSDEQKLIVAETATRFYDL